MSEALTRDQEQALREHLLLDLRAKLVTGDLFLVATIEQDIGTKEWHWQFSNGRRVVSTGSSAFFNDFSAVRTLAKKLMDDYKPSEPSMFLSRYSLRGGTLADD